MDYWNLGWLVVMLGLAVVGPVIALVVSVRGLGVDTLSEKQRRAGEKELRAAGIVREGEEWEARDLDELMLNMRRYDQWKSIGVAATILVTGGAGTVALIATADGWVNSIVYLTPTLGILGGSVVLGVSVGYVLSDRSFAFRTGILPPPGMLAIFSGVNGVARRPWLLRVLEVGLVMAVSICALLYTLGKGGPLEDTTARLMVARHIWLIWCIPVAVCVTVAAREVLLWWEKRRPPLLLTEQPELAGRADLYRRREVYKSVVSDWTVFFSIPWLSMSHLMTFEGLVDFSIQFPLSLAAFGAWIVSILAYGLTDTRRKRQARSMGDAGLHGGGGMV